MNKHVGKEDVNRTEQKKNTGESINIPNVEGKCSDAGS